jgi:4-oxalocrotonate tautomerase
MPYIHVRVTDEGVTREQKAAIIAGATQLMVDILGKQPATTHVVIEEVPLDNWGVGGLPVEEYRARKRAGVG